MIKRIADEPSSPFMIKLWDEIKAILPIEKPHKTVGLPTVPYKEVLDGILYILRTGCQWKMLPSGFGSVSDLSQKIPGMEATDVFKKAMG